MADPIIDPRLAEWASPTQQAYLAAVNEHGSMRAAAKELALAESSIRGAINRLKANAARQGFAPGHFDNGVAPGFQMGKVTVQRGPSGEVERTWERQSPDQERQDEIMRACVAAMTENIRGTSPPIDKPVNVPDDIMAVFPIGDPHIGLYVWAKECGDAFNLDIARDLTLGAVDRLMASAPNAKTAIILLLGDVFHMNDQTNTTPGHKHQLDVDSRFVKVLQVGIETYRHAILRALGKYERVVVKAIPGNHDPQAVWALALTLAAYFSHESRVEVDINPSKFWFYRFGKVLIGSTHGDTCKHEALPGIMACDRPKDWGETEHRYWYTGHVHSQHVREFPGVICESFRTLAAKDSYAAGHGYRAGRDMVCIVQHKDHGEIERHRCDIGMIRTPE